MAKPPHSFSCEEELVNEFKILCANLDTTPSMQIRRFIIHFLKKHNIKVNLKNLKS